MVKRKKTVPLPKLDAKSGYIELDELDFSRKQKKPIPLPKLNFTNVKHGFVTVLLGVIIALILGVLAHIRGWEATWIYWILVLGLVVGIINIFHAEGILFLITLLTATVMLTVLAGLNIFPIWAITLFNAVIYFLATVSIIVSLKVLYALAVKKEV